MIQYSNIVRYDGLPFDKYLALPGYSNSWLKNEKSGLAQHIEVTEKIAIGKMVDSILTDACNVDMNDKYYPIAKDIAWMILKGFKHLIKHFQPQVSFTGEASCNGFKMPVKGRVDWLIKGNAHVDLKITWLKNIQGVINYMEYPNQCWHYAKLAQVPTAYVLIHSVPLKKTELKRLDCRAGNSSFWAEKIVLFGKAVNEETV